MTTLTVKTSRKATHRGGCQWCGAIHKISQFGGVAKHGYKVHAYEGFIGTCYGSGHPPIQVSCGLTKKSIISVSVTIKSTESEIENLEGNDTLENHWYEEYKSGIGYYFVNVDIIDRMTLKTRGNDAMTIDIRNDAGRPYLPEGKSLDPMIEYLRKPYRRFLGGRIDFLKMYRSEQSAIVERWEPTALIQIN